MIGRFRYELVLASKNVATDDKSEHKEAEERLEKLKVITEEEKRHIRDLLIAGLIRLFDITGRWMDYGSVEMEVEGGSEVERRSMPGFSGGSVCKGRCMGMVTSGTSRMLILPAFYVAAGSTWRLSSERRTIL